MNAYELKAGMICLQYKSFRGSQGGCGAIPIPLIRCVSNTVAIIADIRTCRLCTNWKKVLAMLNGNFETFRRRGD